MGFESKNIPKIIFIYPRWTDSYGFFSHFGKKSGSAPPINLALLAALALKEQFNAEIIDGEIDGLSNEYIADKVIEKNPDIVALGGMSPFFHKSVDFIKILRKKGFKKYVFVGGPHITICKEDAFTNDMDIAFIGNAIKSFPLVLNHYYNERQLKKEYLSNIVGLIYKDDGVLKNTGIAIYGKSMDDNPMPARHLLNNKKYKIGTKNGIKIFTTIQTTRGCPWECIYCCSKDLQTNTISRKSPKMVVDEIESCLKDFNITHFLIVDDELTLKKSHTEEICNEILKRGLNITFEGSTRADLVDDSLAKLLVRAGLIRISFGLETTDIKIREIIKKKVSLEKYNTANILFNSLGIEVFNSIMLGLPGDTIETILNTIEYVSNNKLIKQANFAITTPYPGTELYQMAINGDYGLILTTKDYSKYRRYGSAVMQSPNFKPETLIKLQNYGFAKIYVKSWRLKTVYQKYGIIGLILQIYRYITSTAWKVKTSKDFEKIKGDSYEKYNT